MRPKCLPDNREASVRASERTCESEREDARKRGVWREGASEREAQGNGECGGEEGVSRTGTN